MYEVGQVVYCVKTNEKLVVTRSQGTIVNCQNTFGGSTRHYLWEVTPEVGKYPLFVTYCGGVGIVSRYNSSIQFVTKLCDNKIEYSSDFEPLVIAEDKTYKLASGEVVTGLEAEGKDVVFVNPNEYCLTDEECGQKSFEGHLVKCSDPIRKRFFYVDFTGYECPTKTVDNTPFDFYGDKDLKEFFKGSVGDYKDFVENYLTLKDRNLYHFLDDKGMFKSVASRAKFYAYQPFRSHKFEGKISLFQDYKKRKEDRLTALKIGRAFRKLFLELSDKELEILVDEFRREFPAKDYTLKGGMSKEDFNRAYTGTQAEYENPMTCGSRKSLANSCMRHNFNNLPHHPAEAYASGDFKIYWTETEGGLIGSRCVVCVKTGVAGPVYGVDEHSIDLIWDKLKEDGVENFDSSDDWLGAKLLKLEHRGGMILPYLDCSMKIVEELDSEFLYITDKDEGEGGYDCSSYEGLLYDQDPYTYCYNCDEQVPEDDGVVSESNGYSYCSCCYDDTFTRCYHSDREILRDEAVEVVVGRGWYGYNYEVVSEDCLDCYVEVDGVYFQEDLVETNTYNGEPITIYDRDDNWFLCYKSEQWWPNEYKEEDEEGNVFSSEFEKEEV